MVDYVDIQLALQDLGYAHGMLAALAFAKDGAQDRARHEAERRIRDALAVLKEADCSDRETGEDR